MGVIESVVLPLFSPDIAVDVAPDQFAFMCQNAVFSLSTFVWTERRTDGLRVLAIGETPTGASPLDLLRVDLFSSSALPPGIDDRFQFLSAFLRFAFTKVMRRRVLIRPAVRIRGCHTLTEFTHGYERTLLTRAAEEAAARSIYFQETLP